MTWRKVVGSDRYEVSDAGEIRSLNFKRSGRVQVLQQSADSHGYLAVLLYDGSGMRGRSQRWVHQLVAESFLGIRPENLEINHIDGNRTNNSFLNLEYVTRSENLKHAFRLGLKDIRGAKNPRTIATQRRKASAERGVASLLG